MAPGRARKKAVRTEVASVAFAFRFTHFKGTHHPAGKLRSRILPALPTAYRPPVCGRGRRVFRIATPATRTDGRAELDVVFVENMYDPDPADEQYEMTVLYLIREHGRLRIETDHWTMGLFSLDTWRRVLGEAGFEVHEGRYSAAEEEYTVFAGVKL